MMCYLSRIKCSFFKNNTGKTEIINIINEKYKPLLMVKILFPANKLESILINLSRQ